MIYPSGTDFSYSSHGYTLLAAALEGATGRGYGELLDVELVQPAGLTGTQLDSLPADGGASQYEVLSNWARPALRVDNSRGWAGGGLRSTAPDLARFASRLASGDIVSPGTLETVLTEQLLPGDKVNPEGYGLGWRLVDTQEFLGGKRSYRVAHHGGGAAGGSAFLALFVDQRLAVAILTNGRIGSGPLGTLTFDLAAEFLPTLTPPRERTPAVEPNPPNTGG